MQSVRGKDLPLQLNATAQYIPICTTGNLLFKCSSPAHSLELTNIYWSQEQWMINKPGVTLITGFRAFTLLFEAWICSRQWRPRASRSVSNNFGIAFSITSLGGHCSYHATCYAFHKNAISTHFLFESLREYVLDSCGHIRPHSYSRR